MGMNKKISSPGRARRFHRGPKVCKVGQGDHSRAERASQGVSKNALTRKGSIMECFAKKKSIEGVPHERLFTTVFTLECQCIDWS